MVFLIILVVVFILLPLTIYLVLNKIRSIKAKKLESLKKEAFKNKDWMYLLDYDYDNWKNRSYTDEYLDVITKAFNGEKRYEVIDKSVLDYCVYHRFCHKDTSHNKKQMDANVVKCMIYLVSYNNSDPIFKIQIEEHFGEPMWDGKKMHYNYRKTHHQYFANRDNLKLIATQIKEKFCTIDVSNYPRVANGSMSYWTMKTHGKYI